MSIWQMAIMGNKAKKSWLWIFISVFIVIWIGDQLIGAFLDEKIVNLRSASYVFYSQEPGWFIFVVGYRLLLFSGCFIYLVVTIFNIDLFSIIERLMNKTSK